MRIFDENNIEILESEVNSEIGYLKEDKLFIAHHEATEAVEKQSHYEVIAEYPNGGKDVVEVIDVEPVEAREAWDEYEDILRYVKYSEKELAEMEIDELKNKLFETDYVAIKIAEGVATKEEYAETLADRAIWRERINALEEVL